MYIQEKAIIHLIHNPTEQGLKLGSDPEDLIMADHLIHNPTEQGLKQRVIASTGMDWLASHS